MNRLAGKAIWLLALLWVPLASSKAEEKAVLPLPEPGNVTLTLDEYNRLSHLAGKPAKRPDPPPLPFSLQRADLKLRVENDYVRGTIQFDGEVLHKGAVKVPLVAGVTVLDAHQEGKALPLLQENATQTAVLAGPAEFCVTLEVGLPLRIDAGRASMRLPVPMAGSTTLVLAIPGEHTAVNISPGLVNSRASENGRTTITATLVPGQPAILWWTTRETAAPVAAREVRFMSDMKTLVSVSEAQLTVAALAEITVVQGEPAQFEVEVPEGYEITGVSGASLEAAEPGPGILILKVAAAPQKIHQFLISMEKPLSSSKASAPFLAFKRAQRETGEVLVEGVGAMELTAKEEGSLKRMDVKEANPYLRSLARFSPQAAFRYHKQPNESPSLVLEWVRFPDATVLAALAEGAVVTTMVTSEGKSLSEIKLTLRNQAQPFLKVALPAGASILSADVAGEKVKPVEGADGARVPLLRAGFRPTDSYSVSFVIMHSGIPFGKKGDSALSLPKMDIPINLLRWEVFLPERFKVKDFGGDALAIDLLPRGLLGGTIEGADESTLPLNGRDLEQLIVLTPGVRQATTGENESQRNDRDAKKNGQMAQNAPSSNVMNLQRRVAGVLPVAIEVPRAGRAFHFVRPLVVDEETKVTFNYGSK